MIKWFVIFLILSVVACFNRLLLIYQIQLPLHEESVMLNFLQGCSWDLSWLIGGFLFIFINLKRIAIVYWLSLLIILILDVIYFYNTYSHLDAVLWNNTNIISMMAMLSISNILWLGLIITMIVILTKHLTKILKKQLQFFEKIIVVFSLILSIGSGIVLKQGYFKTPLPEIPL